MASSLALRQAAAVINASRAEQKTLNECVEKIWKRSGDQVASRGSLNLHDPILSQNITKMHKELGLVRSAIFAKAYMRKYDAILKKLREKSIANK